MRHLSRSARRGLDLPLSVACLSLALLPALAALAPATALAQGLDISGWTLRQYNSTQTETFPSGTVIQPGGYLIVARYATQAAFEAFYGVTLGSNVVYITHASDATGVPQINGAETFEIRDAGGALVDGPTTAISTLSRAYHRDDPEAADWTSIDTSPTPGSGVEAPDATASGLVITEANDAGGSGNYVYEFVEIYYDASGGAANEYPVISGTQHAPSAPTAADSLTVTTTVTDSDGAVVSVDCYWRQGSGSYAALAMTPTGGGGYRAILEPLQANATLEYYIQAVDDSSATVRDPAGAPATVYSVYVQGTPQPGKVVLWDHAHGQDAGTEGNWRIDDNFPNPSPAAPASESDWSGQLSTWAYELYQAGHTMRSNATPIDAATLAGVDLLVIVEPQNPFAAAEITAIGEWVHAGGSLFVVANHNASDRDNDGWDSPSIFGGYSVPHISVPVGSDVETFCGALFGLHFHVKDEGNNSITGTFANVDTDPDNPIINGPYGPVAAVIYHVGNVMSLWPSANPDLTSVAGHIWKDGDTGNPDANIAAWSRYGRGKIMGYGDSSSCADGTDTEPHANNWTEAGSNNREFFLNATAWLLSREGTGVEDGEGGREGGGLPRLGLGLRAAPNPFNPVTRVELSLPAAGAVDVAVYDLAGRRLRTLCQGQRPAGRQSLTWDGRDDGGRGLPSGVYLVRALGAGIVEFAKVTLAK